MITVLVAVSYDTAQVFSLLTSLMVTSFPCFLNVSVIQSMLKDTGTKEFLVVAVRLSGHLLKPSLSPTQAIFT